MLTDIGGRNRRVDVAKEKYSCLATVWYSANIGPVLLSHNYILSLTRLVLSPMVSSSEISSFSRICQKIFVIEVHLIQAQIGDRRAIEYVIV